MKDDSSRATEAQKEKPDITKLIQIPCIELEDGILEQRINRLYRVLIESSIYFGLMVVAVYRVLLLSSFHFCLIHHYYYHLLFSLVTCG